MYNKLREGRQYCRTFAVSTASGGGGAGGGGIEAAPGGGGRDNPIFITFGLFGSPSSDSHPSLSELSSSSADLAKNCGLAIERKGSPLALNLFFPLVAMK